MRERTFNLTVSGIFLLALIVAVGLGGHLPQGSMADDPTDPAITLHFSPKGGCAEEAVAQIGEAKKTIHVRAYGFTSAPIGEALCAAVKRGVMVAIICDRSELTDKHSQSDECEQAGCDVVFDHAHPISHSKVIVVDSKVSLVGSYNWTNQAEKNAETMATIYHRGVAKQLIADFDKHYQHAKKRNEQ